MRQLTLNEKISIKGVFETKGLSLPMLDMRHAVFLWSRLCGTSISRFYLHRTR